MYSKELNSDVQLKQDQYLFSGHWNYHNILQLDRLIDLDELLKFSDFTFDLQQLESSDTAILALICRWQRLALINDKKLVVKNVPKFMHSMLELFDLDFPPFTKQEIDANSNH